MPLVARRPVPQVLTASASSVDRQTVDEVLWWIHQALAVESGDAFYRELMSHLCSAYGMKYAFITRCVDHTATRVRSLAYWWEDHLRDNKIFPLNGLPCEDMMRQGRPMYLPDRLGEHYPSKKGWAEGYCGMPLMGEAVNGASPILGHIAFFSPGRMARNVLEDPLFHLFAARATGELRRLAADERLQDHMAAVGHLARLGELGEMASLIVHELAQPLTSIGMTARTAQQQLEMSGVAAEAVAPEALQAIADQADRAVCLVRNIRGFARREGEAARDLDIHGPVQNALALADIEARRHSVTVRTHLAPGLPPVRGVRLELEQVMLNLLRNAIQALQQSPAWPRDLLVHTAPDGAGLRVSVCDSGPGIAPEIGERLFHAFATTRPDGLGLGLSLCRQRVEAAGGRIEAWNLHGPRPADTPPDAPAQGACFSVWLPSAHVPSAAPDGA